jgi:alpha-galactosidase/6-phospho-beta-glucosidase family protein
MMPPKFSDIYINIAYIGGGSRGWAHILMNDLAQCNDFHGEVRLYDIDLEAARLNETFGNWIQKQPGVQSPWQYRAVETLGAALKDADFVFLSIQPGPMEMMAHEISVAERFGLYFPVGDTTGAPGLIRGMRSAKIYADFARSIAEHCPEAWVVNYTNPMTICTRTLTKVVPDLKVFGCCHEVFGTQSMLANLTRQYLDLHATPGRDDIHVNVLGINHFTWIDQATYQGHDLLSIVQEHIQKPGVLRQYTQEEVKAARNWFHDADQIKFELFKRYGILAAAGDRHLSEFVPGFTRSPEELFRWGIIRTPVSWRIERWEWIPEMVRSYLSGGLEWSFRDSGEEMARQLRALLGLGDFVTNVNFRNQGQITNLPLDVVVETNAHFSYGLVRPMTAGNLPDGVHAMVSRHVANQEMIIEAALTGDKELAFQAIFNDPTTNLPIDQAWQMFEEMYEYGTVSP